MIHLTRRERIDAAIRNACAKSAHYGRVVPVNLYDERDIVTNHFKQGIAVMEYAHNRLRKDFPRMFE